MKKIIAMIPARLGSQRVPQKNLRLLNGKPLLAYSIEIAKASGVFSEIYVNSEADILGEVALEYGAKFYKRPSKLSTNEAINDDFAYDFIQNVPGNILVQFLPTSPLISAEEVKDFVDTMVKDSFETLVSVEDHQIACLYKGQPVNFSLQELHRSSQTMTPVQSYATVLMAWTYSSFSRNMKEFGCAYHGGKGRVGYYVLKGLSTIDIDHEEDFALAEVALEYRKNHKQYQKKYYQPKSSRREVSEVDVPSILKNDGVMQSDFSHENRPLANLDEIISHKDNTKSWCHRLINTENNSATLISQLPGEGNRLHYHPNWNEWWYIIDGQWEWEIEGQKMTVKKGDIVFIEKNKLHRITAIGSKPAIRLAVSKDLVAHVYPQSDALKVKSFNWVQK